MTLPLEVLRRSRWLILAALIVTPTVAVAVSWSTPAVYRAHATVRVSGRNTGYIGTDVDQAHRAAARNRSLAARTLDVTGVRALDPTELQHELEIQDHRRRGLIEIAIDRPHPSGAYLLADEFARQLAGDQAAYVASPASFATKVAPRLGEDGLLGLALAIPLGAALAVCVEAVRRRLAREA